MKKTLKSVRSRAKKQDLLQKKQDKDIEFLATNVERLDEDSDIMVSDESDDEEGQRRTRRGVNGFTCAERSLCRKGRRKPSPS